jgi:hypothetical protein
MYTSKKFPVLVTYVIANNFASLFQYSNIRIGPVVKKDVMKASTMLEHESQ